MSEIVNDALSRLLARYAEGRELCNCRRAYYTKEMREEWWPQGTRTIDGPTPKRITREAMFCKHGCQANQLSAINEIAERAAEELGLNVTNQMASWKPYGAQ